MSKTIVFIYRPKYRNEHSIENVFDTICLGLERRGYNVIKYYLGKNLIRSIIELHNLRADHYHITGECYYISLFLPNRNTTLTLHDIAFFKKVKMTPKVFIKGLIWLFLPLNYLKKFSVISDIVKKETIENIYIAENKILVIPNPLSMKIDKSPKEYNNYNLKILQIGTGDHKNLIGLIEATKNMSNVSLIIVGNPDENLVALMRSYNINFELYFRISKTELLELYKLCDIVYFASLHEGFGLPILEGQAIGRPVITSNIPPMNDVAGKGAFLVDPNNYSQIEATIRKISTFDKSVLNVIDLGFENVERFNLESILDKYQALFDLEIDC